MRPDMRPGGSESWLKGGRRSRWRWLRRALAVAVAQVALDEALTEPDRVFTKVSKGHDGTLRPARSAGWEAALLRCLNDTRVMDKMAHGKDAMKLRATPNLTILGIGGLMEDVAVYLRNARAEVEESKKTLEKLSNDVRALADVILPSLKDQVSRVREARMSITMEVRDTMVSLREVGTFLARPESDAELERLGRLVSLCREMEDLKKTGMLDALLSLLGGR